MERWTCCKTTALDDAKRVSGGSPLGRRCGLCRFPALNGVGEGNVNPAGPGSASSQLYVVHTTGGLDARYGGPSRSVTALCTALAVHGAEVDLISAANPRVDRSPVLPPSQSVRVHLEPAWHVGRLRYYPAYSTRLRAILGQEGVDRSAVIHDHGLWGHFNWCAWRASRTFGVPYVLSPRGMLEPWALNAKRWKKRLAMMLFQRRILETVDLYVATAVSEYESIRAFGLRGPVAILPNGVDAEAFQVDAAAKRSEGAERTALFLSRIHPKKGLLDLVEAWANATPSGWRLVIAGSDEDGHMNVVMETIRRRRIGDSVSYVGPMDGPAKWALYGSVDLFVLPTYSENFGMVVAEALACGVPVITTKAAPWADLVARRCGWWVEVGVAPLAAALREATSMDPAALRVMGNRGRQFARGFAWTSIAGKFAETYRWLLRGGVQPDWVRLD